MNTISKNKDRVASMRQTIGAAVGVAGLTFAVSLPAVHAKAAESGRTASKMSHQVQNAAKKIGQQARTKLNGQSLARWVNWNNWNNWRNY